MVQIIQGQPGFAGAILGGLGQGAAQGLSKLTEMGVEHRFSQKAKEAERAKKLAGIDKIKKTPYWENASDTEKAIIEAEGLGDISAQTAKSLINLYREQQGSQRFAQALTDIDSEGSTGEDTSSIDDTSAIGEEPKSSPKKSGIDYDKQINKWQKALGKATNPNEKAFAESRIRELQSQRDLQFKENKEERGEKEFAHKETFDYAKGIRDNADKGREIITAADQIEDALKKGASGGNARNIAYSYLKKKQSPLADLFLTEDMQQLISNTKTLAGGFTGLFGKQPTQKEFFWYETILPGILKDVLTNKKSTEYFKKFANLAVKSQDIYDDVVKENRGYRPIDIDLKVRERLKPFTDKLIKEGEELVDFVLMKAPDGSIRQVPKSQSDTYIRQGLEPIE